MAKAKAKRPTKRRDTPATLRNKIERLDRELVKLINERASLAEKAENLSEETVSVGDILHDNENVQKLLQGSKGPLGEECVKAIFRELASGSRALYQVVRVAYLGPEYSYSHLAAIQRFGQSAQLVPVGGIGAVFEEVYRGDAHFGIVPLENSTDGRVTDTLEMFTRLPARICGEVQLEIHHQLLAKCPRSEVRDIFSRPQALSQCRNWLHTHMPSVKTHDANSTSFAAQMARDRPGAAAIASREAGVHFGLDVLAENIEDNAANMTRFAVIGPESAQRSGKDKTAIMFQIDHKVGALADATAIFKRNRLNMTWIESFPIPGQKGAYLFFVEMEGHENDAKVKRAMDSLGKKSLRLEILGSYERNPIA